ncbi:phage baseplate assembly protein domain-containing protein [Falsiroseomonas sp.]|uniref:phage baseplate assembly protein domain-containing protein n=1 Tax=Falsiroseomonas sp. TaxID=2870721 RepID=UPI003F72B6A3
MSERDVMQARGQVVRGVVVAIRDDGQAQTVDVETHEGILRAAVEVLQPFGDASRAPLGPGTMVLLLAVGGDQGDMVALPVAMPSLRFGGLQPGEKVIYDADGNRVHLRAGGIVEVHAATKIRLVAPLVEIEAATVTISGNLDVAGQVSDADGSMQEMRDRYNGHGHPGTSGPPTPAMD